jgi:hypothetical protein
VTGGTEFVTFAEAEQERSAEIHYGQDVGVLLVVERGDGLHNAADFAEWGSSPSTRTTR